MADNKHLPISVQQAMLDAKHKSELVLEYVSAGGFFDDLIEHKMLNLPNAPEVLREYVNNHPLGRKAEYMMIHNEKALKLLRIYCQVYPLDDNVEVSLFKQPHTYELLKVYIECKQKMSLTAEMRLVNSAYAKELAPLYQENVGFGEMAKKFALQKYLI